VTDADHISSTRSSSLTDILTASTACLGTGALSLVALLSKLVEQVLACNDADDLLHPLDDKQVAKPKRTEQGIHLSEGSLLLDNVGVGVDEGQEVDVHLLLVVCELDGVHSEPSAGGDLAEVHVGVVVHLLHLLG